MQKKKEVWRAVKFVLFSASAGIIQIGLFTLLNELAKWSYWPCYLIALVASVVWNFTLNRKFTFKSANNVPKAMALVLCYYAVFTPVSYTHLTLPTNREVEISVDAGTITKKKKK